MPEFTRADRRSLLTLCEGLLVVVGALGTTGQAQALFLLLVGSVTVKIISGVNRDE